MTGDDRAIEPSSEEETGSPTLSRRTALGLGAALVAGAALGPSGAGATVVGTRTSGGSSPTATDLLRPEIAPRDAWGADLAHGEIVPEEDVRFLLVHHTASTNDYRPDGVVDQIRDFHAFHTGPEKDWPDVAYNFLVDRFGGVWEARAGSLAGPVRGDATGGSQGFALLCSLIGDYSQVPLPDPARRSMVRLLAWLAERHDVDTQPGATVDFISRGSNRWDEGTPVTAATISGHRDMSQTSCPGDFVYDLLAVEIPQAVTDLRLQARTTAASSTTTTSSAAAVAPTTATTAASLDPTAASGPTVADQQAAGPVGGDDAIDPVDLAVGTTAALGAIGLAAGAVRNRRRRET